MERPQTNYNKYESEFSKKSYGLKQFKNSIKRRKADTNDPKTAPYFAIIGRGDFISKDFIEMVKNDKVKDRQGISYKVHV
jgi:hypothetical protein